MPLDIALGLQWGDEGKGKIVDVLSPHYDIIARFQGGPNAGHTLEFNQTKHVLHLIPSGIFRDNVMNVVGNGVVMNPTIFAVEIAALEALGVPVRERLLIGKRAHLILPTHRLLDAAAENAKGKQKIGSTLQGIGPAYMDKTGRNGLRVGDILEPNFREKYDALVHKHQQLLSMYDYPDTHGDLEDEWFAGIELIKSFKIIDSERYINDALLEKKSVLAEGAQGTLLDVDFGTYPYVTSSNTTAAGACIGLGVPPTSVRKVIGIFKAYATRVGSGPFPSELEDADGEKLRATGKEFGATTGRPRRCGWLDLPALRYAVKINGVTDLIMMKADILCEFDSVKIATHYERAGQKIPVFPYDGGMDPVTPVYTIMPSWKCDWATVRSWQEIPEELKAYSAFVESELAVPIVGISVGPEREQILFK